MLKFLLLVVISTLVAGQFVERMESVSGCGWKGSYTVQDFLVFTCEEDSGALWTAPLTNQQPMVWTNDDDLFQVLLLDAENLNIFLSKRGGYSCINPLCQMHYDDSWSQSFQLASNGNASLVIVCANAFASCEMSYSFRLDSIWPNPTPPSPSLISYSGWLQPHSCQSIAGTIRGDNLISTRPFTGNPCHTHPLQSTGIGAMFSSSSGSTLVWARGWVGASNVSSIWQKWVGGQYQSDWTAPLNLTLRTSSAPPPSVFADLNGALHAFVTDDALGAAGNMYYQYCNTPTNCSAPRFFQHNVSSFGVGGGLNPYGNLVVCFFLSEGSSHSPYCREQTDGQDTWTTAFQMPFFVPRTNPPFFVAQGFSPVLFRNEDDQCLYAVQLGKDYTKINSTINNPYYRLAIARWCNSYCHLTPGQASCWTDVAYQPNQNMPAMQWSGCLALQQSQNYLVLSSGPNGTPRVATFDGSTLYVMDQPKAPWNGEWTTTTFSRAQITGNMPALAQSLSRYYVFATMTDGSLGYIYTKGTNPNQWQTPSFVSVGLPPSGLPLTVGQVATPMELYDVQSLHEIGMTAVVVAADSSGFVHTFDPLRQSSLTTPFYTNSSSVILPGELLTVFWNISPDLADPCVVIVFEDSYATSVYGVQYLTGTPVLDSNGNLIPCVPGQQVQAQTSGAFQFVAPSGGNNALVLRFSLGVPIPSSSYYMLSSVSKSFTVAPAPTGLEEAIYFGIGLVKGLTDSQAEPCPSHSMSYLHSVASDVEMVVRYAELGAYSHAIGKLGDVIALLEPLVECYSGSADSGILSIFEKFDAFFTVIEDLENVITVFEDLHNIYDDFENLVLLWEADQYEEAGEQAGKIIQLLWEILRAVDPVSSQPLRRRIRSIDSFAKKR